jgi:hypothetical protein
MYCPISTKSLGVDSSFISFFLSFFLSLTLPAQQGRFYTTAALFLALVRVNIPTAAARMCCPCILIFRPFQAFNLCDNGQLD